MIPLLAESIHFFKRKDVARNSCRLGPPLGVIGFAYFAPLSGARFEHPTPWDDCILRILSHGAAPLPRPSPRPVEGFWGDATSTSLLPEGDEGPASDAFAVKLLQHLDLGKACCARATICPWAALPMGRNGTSVSLRRNQG